MSASELIEHALENRPIKFQEKVIEMLESKVLTALEREKINISSSINESKEDLEVDDEDLEVDDEDLELDFDFDLDEDCDDLNEAISDGDTVSWNDDVAKKQLTGTVKFANGMKKNGVKHAIVSVSGAEFSVPHNHLTKLES